MFGRERILRTLASLGCSEIDSKIYLHLAMKSPQKGKDVAEALNLHKQQFYRSIKHLQGKGVVTSSFERPTQFSAVPLEKALELLIEAKKEQALTLQRNRQELLSSWRAVIKEGICN